MDCLEKIKEKFLGKQVEFHSYGATAYNQCTDLVNLYINLCLDNETKDYTEIIGANAKDFKDKFDPKDFDFIANETTPNVVPERGDIPIWNGRVGGGAGHVAIILEADGMKFTSLDQNWSQIERVTIETHNYTNVSGWLRPKSLAVECPEKPLQLDTDIPAEVEEKFKLKSFKRYSKYWSFEELIKDWTKITKELDEIKSEYENDLAELTEQLEEGTRQYNILLSEKESLETKLESLRREMIENVEKYELDLSLLEQQVQDVSTQYAGLLEKYDNLAEEMDIGYGEQIKRLKKTISDLEARVLQLQRPTPGVGEAFELLFQAMKEAILNG